MSDERHSEPPWTETGEILPWTFLLVRTADVLVQLTSFVAYSSGLEFAVDARTNVPNLLSDLILPPVDIFSEEAQTEEEVFVSDCFIEAVTSTTRVSSGPRDSSGSDEVLTATIGRGDRHRWKQSWWLSPLPEGDLLDLSIRWEKVGVDEVVQLDAIEVRAAGYRSLVWTEDD
jgi:hypothetical protein